MSSQTTASKDEPFSFDDFVTKDDPDFKTCNLSQSFDRLFMCYALGGQAMHYYRYGTAKNCSSTYEDLKLCMKIKTKPQDVAKKMWAEREAVKEAARNKEQSSLDVWTLRETPPVFPASPFPSS
ncbi:hypothetical protein BC938DRAFT_483183 [Jimgerdemannia flammicorona]|uniref:Early meiotic induction protein 1 n=1 Tax=Jimgerdemannia flammicorona TaxID=994334 RepID=A0A433QVW2_9FUNG|nr:hypothetical protein BC938DRAFT_483183 [Jimgerdemannia flammicorona]